MTEFKGKTDKRRPDPKDNFRKNHDKVDFSNRPKRKILTLNKEANNASR